MAGSCPMVTWSRAIEDCPFPKMTAVGGSFRGWEIIRFGGGPAQDVSISSTVQPGCFGRVGCATCGAGSRQSGGGIEAITGDSASRELFGDSGCEGLGNPLLPLDFPPDDCWFVLPAGGVEDGAPEFAALPRRYASRTRLMLRGTLSANWAAGG